MIIDEFQDTDPLQWQIFYKLFLEEKNAFVYLVGDPKQSIYAFRNADIYTYLRALRAVGEENRYCLTTNYRSEPGLIAALNALFDENSAPSWLSLPHLKQSLPYLPVNTPESVKVWPFKDHLSAVHFCTADAQNAKLEVVEERLFFPYFATEIGRLKREEGFSYQQIAILVRDRFQADRLAEHLKKCRIAVSLQRSSSLSSSPALQALIEVLNAVLHPSSDKHLKIALGGKLFGYSSTDLMQFEDNATWIEKLCALKKLWREKGFGRMFQALLDMRVKPVPYAKRFCGARKVKFFWHELMHAASLLLEEEARLSSPERL